MQSVLLFSVVCLAVVRCVDSRTGLDGLEPYLVDREIEQQLEKKNPVNNDRRRLGSENPVTRRQETEYLSRQEFNDRVQNLQNKMADMNTVLIDLKWKYATNEAFRAYSTEKRRENLGASIFSPWHFDVVDFNIGKSFDSTNGFKCPYKGIFLLHSHLNLVTSAWIIKNDVKEVQDMAGYSDVTVLFECEADEVANAGTGHQGKFEIDKPNYQGILLKRLY